MAKRTETENRDRIASTTRSFRLTGLSPLLGGLPANEDLYTRFVASKAPADVEDDVRIKTYAEQEAVGLTVFPVDDEDVPMILAYQLQGFFKEALYTLRGQHSVRSPKAAIDNYLFIDPNGVYLYRRGELIREPDDRKERPLRREYMGTTMTTLASSERINTPWETEIDIRLIDGGKPRSSTKYASLTWDHVLMALDYGQYKGLLQWRNAGWGRFTWEEITG